MKLNNSNLDMKIGTGEDIPLLTYASIDNKEVTKNELNDYQDNVDVIKK
jgi:hypothetical protein